MTLRSRILTSIILIAVLLFSCTRHDSENLPHLPLTPFTITVMERGANSAQLEWTSAANTLSRDTIWYKIQIGDLVIASDIIELKFTVQNLIPDSTYTGRIIAYNRRNDTISAPIVIDKIDGYLYLSTRYNQISCLNLFTGVQIWQKFIVPSLEYGYPLLSNDTVFYMMDGGSLWAFDAINGDQFWKTSAILGPTDRATPTYHNGIIYLSLSNGLYAINSRNGNLIWQYKKGENLFITSPVIMEEKVIAAVNGLSREMMAFDQTSGHVAWKTTLPSYPTVSPVVFKNLIIFGMDDASLYALDGTTGKIVWSHNLSVPYNNYGCDYLPPVIYKDRVLIHDGNRGLHALDAATGKKIWLNDVLRGPASGGICIGNDMIYCMYLTTDADQNHINYWVAIDPTTGKTKWEKKITPPISMGNLILIKDRIYVPGAYKDIFVYDAANGNHINTIYTMFGPYRFIIKQDDILYYPSISGMQQ